MSSKSAHLGWLDLMETAYWIPWVEKIFWDISKSFHWRQYPCTKPCDFTSAGKNNWILLSDRKKSPSVNFQILKAIQCAIIKIGKLRIWCVIWNACKILRHLGPRISQIGCFLTKLWRFFNLKAKSHFEFSFIFMSSSAILMCDLKYIGRNDFHIVVCTLVNIY